MSSAAVEHPTQHHFDASGGLDDSEASGTLHHLTHTVQSPQDVIWAVAQHLACSRCRTLRSDAVLVTDPMPERVFCRPCAAAAVEGSSDQRLLTRELPAFIQAALNELVAAMAHGNTSSGIAAATTARKIVKVKRPSANAASTVTPQRLSQEGPSASPDRSAVTTSSGGAPVDPATNNTPPPHATPSRGVPPITVLEPNTVSTVGRTDPATQLQLHREEKVAVAGDEAAARAQISVDESVALLELQRRHAALIKLVKKSNPIGSRQLKMEADEKYEAANYPLAYELYTRAIQIDDGTTRASGLYGNRSAALFMLLRYEECIQDCLEAVKRDSSSSSSHGRIKMLQRAIKSAIQLGDLDRAVTFYEQCDLTKFPSEAVADMERAKRGAETLRRAKELNCSPEAEDAWRMLVAEFGDVSYFRLQLAVCFEKMGKLEKAVETLNRIPGPCFNADCALALGRAYYLSGFEYFEKAKEILGEWRHQSAACETLLSTVLRVDDGKQRGNSLFSNRQFAESVDAYTNAITEASTNGRILRILYCNRAAAYKELKRYREGIDDCTKALAFDSQFPKPYARRARCYLAQDDFTAAIRDFKQGLALDPSDTDLQRELRNAEAMQQKEIEREKDYYYVLGIQRTATEKDIKQKYRELSLKWHPDKCVNLPAEERANAERKFKLISESHATLVDPVKRREYDLKSEREAMFKGASARSSGFSSYEPRGGAGAGAYASDPYASAFPSSRAGPQFNFPSGRPGARPW